jgi:hypothetical protein
VSAHLAIRYSNDEAGDVYDGIGLATGISAHGLSLATPRPLGQPGDRLRLAFQLKSGGFDTQIRTGAIIRNVQANAERDEPVTHGLEFDRLDPAQQLPLKAYVLDRRDDSDAAYWAKAPR